MAANDVSRLKNIAPGLKFELTHARCYIPRGENFDYHSGIQRGAAARCVAPANQSGGGRIHGARLGG
jgi:hypothetical protein